MIISQAVFDKFYLVLDEHSRTVIDRRGEFDLMFNSKLNFCEADGYKIFGGEKKISTAKPRYRWIGRSWILCMIMDRAYEPVRMRLWGDRDAFFEDITEGLLRL